MIRNDYVHIPVLLDEVIEGLAVRPDGNYVDCTFGRGGHSKAILSRLDHRGKLFVLDKDPAAISSAEELSSLDSRVQCFHASFSELHNRLNDFAGTIDGILFDLGVSSPQLDTPERGFSFSQEGTLDMRMDTTSGMSAADWINHAPMDEISQVLKEFGEEKFSRRIAKAVIGARSVKPISTTVELSRIIVEAVPVREKNKHPATRSFQAIRIFLNNELDELGKGLVQAFELLRVGGRLAVISFHSLEDRIVKRFFREYSKNDPYPIEVPVTAEMIKPKLKILGKLIQPGEPEISANPRARSARLRVAEKLGK
jgi:16S rRNA (cytosine1402-N4)-methyltransferase